MKEAFTRSDTWICFDCRQVARRSAYAEAAARCGQCGAVMYNAGKKCEVPKKGDDRGWKTLREFVRSLVARKDETTHLALVRKKHDLEKRISSGSETAGSQERSLWEREMEECKERLRALGY